MWGSRPPDQTQPKPLDIISNRAIPSALSPHPWYPLQYVIGRYVSALFREVTEELYVSGGNRWSLALGEMLMTASRVRYG